MNEPISVSIKPAAGHMLVSGRMLDVLRVVTERLGLHWITVQSNGVKMIDAPNGASDVFVLGVLLAVVLVSILTYNLIERPAREWSRRQAARIWNAPGAPVMS